MTNQLSLTLPPVSHSGDPGTSRRAEAKINKTGQRATHAAVILAAVRKNPGCTAPELMVVTRLGEYQIRRRLSDLREIGRVNREHERDGNSCWWPA